MSTLNMDQQRLMELILLQQTQTAAVGYSASITGLASNTTYHYQAVLLYNTNQYVYGSDLTFTTNSLGAVTLTTGTISNLTSTSATLIGTLTSLGDYASTGVSVYFQWGSTTLLGNTTTPQPLSSLTSFSAPITGLTAGTNYYFVAYASYGALTWNGSQVEFATTGIAVPSLSVASATSIGSTIATLQCGIASMGGYSSVTVYFEYGISASYGTTTAYQTFTSATTFNQPIIALTASTVYYFRADITYGTPVTTLNGNGQNFTTGSMTTPSISTVSATSIGTTTVTLNGNLTNIASYTSAQVSFEIGVTSSYSGGTSP